jgi:hypothetical protein
VERTFSPLTATNVTFTSPSWNACDMVVNWRAVPVGTPGGPIPEYECFDATVNSSSLTAYGTQMELADEVSLRFYEPGTGADYVRIIVGGAWVPALPAADSLARWTRRVSGVAASTTFTVPCYMDAAPDNNGYWTCRFIGEVIFYVPYNVNRPGQHIPYGLGTSGLAAGIHDYTEGGGRFSGADSVVQNGGVSVITRPL